MASKVTELQQELEQIMAGYDAGFAGQARATRDLAVLDELIARLKKLVPQLEKAPAGEVGSTLETARTQLKMYENEHVEITNAKAGGSDALEFSQLAAFANFVFARYLRHYAGKPRNSRDVGLIKEMSEELRAIRKKMSVILSVGPNASFQSDADLVSRMVERYEEEQKAIEAAQLTGTAEERAGNLAELANSQIDLYRQHFMGQARITRRPALLQRIIENLRRIRSAMASLQLPAKGAENNRSNLSIVENTLRHDEAELIEIRKTRQAAPMKDILGMLGGAANEIFDEYRKRFGGQDRRQVDLNAFSVLCDKLGEIARQMYDIGRTEESEMNERNLEIVSETLRQYEEEWKAINKAQNPGADS